MDLAMVVKTKPKLKARAMRIIELVVNEGVSLVNGPPDACSCRFNKIKNLSR